MNRKEAREAVESLQNVLIARATGGSADGIGYRELRDTLREDDELRDLLPTFVRTSRDLSQFWAYIQQFSEYRERREHIWAAFAPILEYLEGAPLASQPPPPDRPATAATTDAAEPLRRIRAFISYSTVDRSAAGAVKRALSTYDIDCFLAHEDIEVSEEWRERILEEISACQVFIPLLSKSFKSSDWVPQEVGAIASRPNVAIVPLSLDETIPFGFIANIQGVRVPATGVDPQIVLDPLSRRFPRVVIPGMIARVRSAATFRGAEAAMRPLVSHFGTLTQPELDALVRASIENGQVWSAAQCRDEYLPELIRANRPRIKAADLKALEYQIANDRWYRSEA
jgi:hypothetical protein